MMYIIDHFITVEKFTQIVKPTSFFCYVFKSPIINGIHILIPYYPTFLLLLDEPEIDDTMCPLLANNK